MKKIFIALGVVAFIVIFTGSGFCQKLVITPDGLRDAEDKEKSYVVIMCEGLTAQQLYHNAYKYLQKMYKNPDSVLKGNVENEYIKFNTHVPLLLEVNNAGAKIPFSANYTTELHFKDNKVKYEISSLSMIGAGNYSNTTFPIVGGMFTLSIFNKKGELRKEQEKERIELFFEADIKIIKENLLGTGTAKKENDW